MEYHNDFQAPLHNDIKIEYHPSSKREPEIFHFEDYKPYLPTDDPSNFPPPNSEPWKPFRSRLDFELAEFMHNAHFNESQSAELISLIQKCVDDPKSFTLTGIKDLKNCWEHARELKATTVSIWFF